jgi:hypothetical protein
MKSEIEPVDRSRAGIYERDNGQRLDGQRLDGQRLELSFAHRMLGGTRRPSLTAIETDRRSAVTVLQWSPERLTIRAVLNDLNGNPRERVLLIEDGWLVEGPPPDDETSEPAARWKRVRPADTADNHGH